MTAPVTLYGPTMPDARDRAHCESCNHSIPRGDDCYVFDIGGGTAEVCVPCGKRMLAGGAASLAMMPVTEYERVEWTRCADDMDKRGHMDNARVLRDMAASERRLTCAAFDRAASIYRAWLVFDLPRAERAK